jgi:hypothetical protein
MKRYPSPPANVYKLACGEEINDFLIYSVEINILNFYFFKNVLVASTLLQAARFGRAMFFLIGDGY